MIASLTRLHIVAIAALGALTFGWLFTGRYLPGVAAVVALDWFLVNLTNRVVDVPEDRANAIPGAEIAARFARPLVVGCAALLVGSLAAVHLVWPAVLPWRVAFHALGLAYNYPLLPGGRRIKTLYFWKNTASATGFLLTVFAYPLAIERARAVPLATVAFAGVFFFLFELSYEVIYDLRDAPGDRAAGVRTYPVVHGERGAVRIVDALLAGAAAALALGYAAGLVPWRLFVMIAAPALQLVLYKRALRRGITSADCVAITWFGAGLLATYHAWIALGLPGIS